MKKFYLDHRESEEQLSNTSQEIAIDNPNDGSVIEPPIYKLKRSLVFWKIS